MRDEERVWLVACAGRMRGAAVEGPGAVGEAPSATGELLGVAPVMLPRPTATDGGVVTSSAKLRDAKTPPLLPPPAPLLPNGPALQLPEA